MGVESWKLFGQIAGIGGLSLGVLLVLFREIIRKSIFPNLTKKQAYRVIMTTLVLVWSIALVGLILWFYSGDNTKSATSSKSELSLTNTFVNYNNKSGADLDFRVINTGGKIISINRVRLYALSLEKILPPGEPEAFVPSTASYGLDISKLAKGMYEEVQVAHSLKPNTDDRFETVVSATGIEKSSVYKWNLQPVLLTNEGETKGEPFKLVIEGEEG